MYVVPNNEMRQEKENSQCIDVMVRGCMILEVTQKTYERDSETALYFLLLFGCGTKVRKINYRDTLSRKLKFQLLQSKTKSFLKIVSKANANCYI